jgi:hypothetical protein
MAPEVANGRYGKEIDIYALGVILYEMLTGHVPFEGESIGEVLMKHLTAEADVGRLAEPYRTVVARALAKAPEVRFHSVGEMVAMLPRPDSAAAPHFSHPRPHPPHRDHPTIPPAGVQASAWHSESGFDERHALHDEPIARGVRNAAAHLRLAWNNATEPGTPARKILTTVLIVMAIFTIHIWTILLFGSCVLYVLYIGVRAIVLSFMYPVRSRRHSAPTSEPRPAPANSPAAAAVPQPTPAPAPVDIRPLAATLPGDEKKSRWRPRGKAIPVLEIGTPRERSTQLVGSLILSSVVALVVSLVMVVVRGGQFEANQYVWLAFTATAGAWGVLIPGKLWEGRDGDPIVRRFVLLVVGLSIGALAYGLYQGLLVRLPNEVDWSTQGPIQRDLFQKTYDSSGLPMPMAFLAYVGFLYLVPRWWRQTDPLRKTRLSVFFTGVIALWALVLHQFWFFPQPWGVMLAVTISIAVQLSSRWVLPQDRTLKHVTA